MPSENMSASEALTTINDALDALASGVVSGADVRRLRDAKAVLAEAVRERDALRSEYARLRETVNYAVEHLDLPAREYSQPEQEAIRRLHAALSSGAAPEATGGASQ